MATIKTKGIVISENNMGDFDKMLTLLTPNGKISCSARGSRRPKSQLMAGSQFLCFGDYMLFKSPSTYSLNSCEPIEIFYNIRMDLDKLQYVVNITKIIQEVTDENQNTYKILQLYLNTLYVISETDLDLEFILSIFKLRLMCLLGFTPIIQKCVNCGEQNNLNYFSFKDNGFKCRACSKQDKSTVEISDSTKKAIQYIVTVPAKKIYSFDISDENKKQLALVSKLYTNLKLENN